MLYLIFNESYATSSGEALQRVDLSSEAIRLARAAVAMARGPADGLALLEKLDRDPGTKDHYRLDAVRIPTCSGARAQLLALEDRSPPGELA